jgi:TolB-like protein/Flp pilus assembly protein TadD
MDRRDIWFGPFRLDLQRRELTKDGTPIRLGARALDLLCVLAAAGGDVVTKDELMERIWPGQVIEDNALQAQISALRKALADDGENYIGTMQGRGYRLQKLNSDFDKCDIDRSNIGVISGASIAVLPFQNMSGDPEQEYFVDGIVEDIISGLARIKSLSVIARNSTFSYKGKVVDIKAIGNELGARYVLEGSVRKVGNRVRITAQLIEAQTRAHLWAERYDRLLYDVFAVQYEIATSVTATIEPNLRRWEIERVKRKRPDSLDAYDLVLRALPLVYTLMPSDAVAAIPLLERALTLDPGYAAAHAALAWCFQSRFSRGDLNEKDRSLATHHARAAIRSGGDDSTTLATAALIIWYNDHEDSSIFSLFDRALLLSSSNVVALRNSAMALSWMGNAELAIERAHHAVRLSPFDPLNYHAYNALAVAHLHSKRYEEAASAARHAAELNPSYNIPWAFLAAALVHLGRLVEAKAAARQVLTLTPAFTIKARSRIVGHVPAVFEPIAAAWQEAGLPK